jgi:GR25 family glycosyltransferase involved in LPS biosynthesis
MNASSIPPNMAGVTQASIIQHNASPQYNASLPERVAVSESSSTSGVALNPYTPGLVGGGGAPNGGELGAGPDLPSDGTGGSGVGVARGAGKGEFGLQMPPIPDIDAMPCVCINLARRADRWTRFSAQSGVKRLPLLQRFNAVDASKEIDVMRDSRISTFAKRNIFTKTRSRHAELNSVGAVGCAMSHINVWKQLVGSGYPYYLVFEDDSVVPDKFTSLANDFIKKLNMLARDANFKWDLWIMGPQWLDYTVMGSELAGISQVHYFQCCNAYVITSDFAQRMLIEVLPIEGHIDHWISQYALNNERTMIGTPLLKLKQAESLTDIQMYGLMDRNAPLHDGGCSGPRTSNTIHLSSVVNLTHSVTSTVKQTFVSFFPPFTVLCIILAIIYVARISTSELAHSGRRLGEISPSYSGSRQLR